MPSTSLPDRTKAYWQTRNVQTYPDVASTKRMSVPHLLSNGYAPLLPAKLYMPDSRIRPSTLSNFRIPVYEHIPPNAMHVSYVPTFPFSDASFHKTSPVSSPNCSTKEPPFYTRDGYISVLILPALPGQPNGFYPKHCTDVHCFYPLYE